MEAVHDDLATSGSEHMKKYHQYIPKVMIDQWIVG